MAGDREKNGNPSPGKQAASELCQAGRAMWGSAPREFKLGVPRSV